jgi:tetratricopeptide (TPR) repeat protein
MVTSIFTVISILYAFRSLQIGRLVWQNWGEIRGERFSPEQKSLAQKASFFLAVPVAVIFHELSHALAVWLFGGQVVDFGYYLYWGFVQPAGEFSVIQQWFIALAGTLGSLLFGLGLWLVLRRNPSPTIRYFGLRAFRFQIFFSLLYYPIFTLIGFYGDWRMIYDFNQIPVIAGLTAAVHAVLLVLFWWADRIGWFEMATFQTLEQGKLIDSRDRDTTIRTLDAEQQLRIIELYRRGGADKKSKRELRNFLVKHPDSAKGQLLQAAIQTENGNRYPRSARDSAESALKLGLDSPSDLALAYSIMGQYSLNARRYDEAIELFNQGLSATRQSGTTGATAHLTYLRGVAQRRKGQLTSAYQDVQQAILLAQQAGHSQSVAQYQQELETIEHQSPRPPGSSVVNNNRDNF